MVGILESLAFFFSVLSPASPFSFPLSLSLYRAMLSLTRGFCAHASFLVACLLPAGRHVVSVERHDSLLLIPIPILPLSYLPPHTHTTCSSDTLLRAIYCFIYTFLAFSSRAGVCAPW